MKLAHPHSTAGAWPALCCLVTDARSGLPLGIHAIYLSSDGSSLAPIPAPTSTLGICPNGIVRLDEPSGDMITVGVGIETCLMAAQNGAGATWATLSERDLASLELPRQLRDVIILAGSLPASRDAAQAAAWRWRSQGRRAVIVAPLQEMESCGCPCSRPVTEAVH